MAKNDCSIFFPTIFPKRTGINLEWPKMAVLYFFQQFFPKDWYKFRVAKNDHYNFSNNFPQKDCYKFRMANGCSEFFPTIFPKKTGINLEWPKMVITNFSQQFFPKRLVQIQNGQKWLFQIFSNIFSQKDWYKFRIAKNGHSKFFSNNFPKKTGTNSEWSKWPF